MSAKLKVFAPNGDVIFDSSVTRVCSLIETVDKWGVTVSGDWQSSKSIKYYSSSITENTFIELSYLNCSNKEIDERWGGALSLMYAIPHNGYADIFLVNMSTSTSYDVFIKLKIFRV